MQKSFLWRFWLTGFFTVMAFNGHIYFLVGILRGKGNKNDFFINIVFSNLYDASLILIISTILIYFTKKIRYTFLRYLILNVFIILSTFFKFYLFSFIYSLIRPSVYTNIDNTSRDFYDLLFTLGPLFGANIVYYWLTRDREQIVKMTEQEFQLLQMNDLKTKAELEALQAKINPHFLYNSLNSVASLVHENPEKAEQMVLNLSKFYRYSTGRNNEYYDTAQNEIEMVITYLEVEKVRFDERLEYSVQYTDESLKSSKIPRFLIQPIVENALKHGLSKIAGQGIIKIVFNQIEQNLEISVYDNGVPFPENIMSGYGLKSIQDKLRLLCGENTSMELLNIPEKRVRILIESPPAPRGGV
jgi:two-component system, LytTR family, sensor kinase